MHLITISTQSAAPQTTIRLGIDQSVKQTN
jgi:hypothetical protein